MRLASPSSHDRTHRRLALFDFLWLVCSPFIALWLRDPSFVDPAGLPDVIPVTYQYSILTIFSSIPFFLIFRLSDGLTHLFSTRDALSCFAATSSSVIASVFTVFTFSRLDGIPRPVPIIFGLVLLFGLLVYRLTVRSFYEKAFFDSINFFVKRDSSSFRRVLIVGLDAFAISAIRLIDNQRSRTTLVVACVSLQGKYVGRSIKGVNIIGELRELGSIIDEYKIHGVLIDEVWVSDSSQYFSSGSWDFIKKTCDSRGIYHQILSNVFGLTSLNREQRPPQNDELSIEPPRSSYLLLKRFLDVICALSLSVILFPIFLIIVMLTLFDLGPPILFWQERVGRYGNSFRLYKVRTLAVPLNQDGELVEDSRRLTHLGEILRRLRLDEIPQLLNIIIGEMSGIGPRPLLPRDQPENKFVRLLIRPGITGWAQVNGGELLNPEEKNALDCWYVYNASLSLDLYIIIKTFDLFIHGVRRNEEVIAQAQKWMQVQRDFVVDP